MEHVLADGWSAPRRAGIGLRCSRDPLERHREPRPKDEIAEESDGFVQLADPGRPRRSPAAKSDAASGRWHSARPVEKRRR